MKKNRKKDSALPLAEAIIKGIQEKKGHDVVCLDLTRINSAVCDYFIVCHGDSHRQVEAIADSVEEQVRKITGEKPWHQEGTRNTEWVVIDYVNVVTHVFLREKRDFYNLEGLWADADLLKISENGAIKILTKKDTAKSKSGNSGKPVKKAAKKPKIIASKR